MATVIRCGDRGRSNDVEALPLENATAPASWSVLTDPAKAPAGDAAVEEPRSMNRVTPASSVGTSASIACFVSRIGAGG